MKKIIPFLTAALLLTSCSLLPSNNAGKASESAPAAQTSQVQEELEIDQEDAAEAALMQATIGMGMIADSPLATPAGLTIKRASAFDGIKQNLAEMIASQVANFRITCGVENGSYANTDSDREGYASMYTITVGLGAYGKADAKLYYSMLPDLTYTGGLKMAIDGLAVLEQDVFEVPEFPIEGAFYAKYNLGVIQTAFNLKVSLDERNYVECISDYAAGDYTSLRDINVKVCVDGSIVFDEVVGILIPAEGSTIVYVTYHNDQFNAKVAVSLPETDAYRIECTVSYMGFSSKLNADAVLARDNNGNPKTVTVHYDEDAADVLYVVNV